MRAGFNPTRRNRNIGTPWQGHGKDNRLVIPVHRHVMSFLDPVGKHHVEQRNIIGHSIRFVTEVTRAGCYHPCSIDDVASLLQLLPPEHWAGIETILFRQPTRKQEILNLAWGRLVYFGQVVNIRKKIIAEGPMILLEAVQDSAKLTWPRQLNRNDQEELQRLRKDGHRIEQSSRHHIITVSRAAARNTQLYRTMLHEIGHWRDWTEKVEIHSSGSAEYADASDRYFARPQTERETYAHRYADGMLEHLRDRGLIPIEAKG